MNQWNIVQLLKESVHRPSGELQISHNGISWNIGLSGAQLHYAFHSLQTLENLAQFIQNLGFESILSTYHSLLQDHHGWSIGDAVGQLLDRQILNPTQAQQLLRALAEDALRSLFWITSATSHWQEQALAPSSLRSISLDLNDLLRHLEQRNTSWQSLQPVITTPHQCPRCDNLARLEQPIAQGVLPTQTLAMMTRLMQGISIYQLAFLLKQDVLKLCQVLRPYIHAGVLQLAPPQAPYNQLPTIPAANTPPSVTQRPIGNDAPIGRPPISHAPNQPQYKIVCIDDSPTVLETIQRYLGTEQFAIATVEDPMASLSALFDMKPDLILMDVSMPGIDGNRLCQILKRSSIFTHVPIIMVSGNTGILDKEKAKAAGATDYLTKPFSKEELLAIIQQYLVKESTYAM
jgi:twitching motility two-component system response regulator PilG